MKNGYDTLLTQSTRDLHVAITYLVCFVSLMAMGKHL